MSKIKKKKFIFVKLKIDLGEGGEYVKCKKLTTILNIDSKHPKILQFL